MREIPGSNDVVESIAHNQSPLLSLLFMYETSSIDRKHSFSFLIICRHSFAIIVKAFWRRRRRPLSLQSVAQFARCVPSRFYTCRADVRRFSLYRIRIGRMHTYRYKLKWNNQFINELHAVAQYTSRVRFSTTITYYKSMAYIYIYVHTYMKEHLTVGCLMAFLICRSKLLITGAVEVVLIVASSRFVARAWEKGRKRKKFASLFHISPSPAFIAA